MSSTAIPSLVANPQTVKEAANVLAATSVHAQLTKAGELPDFSTMFQWLKDNPVIAGSLIGVGGGALYGGLSSLFRDKEERVPVQSTITGALGGGLMGLGAGLGYKYLPKLLHDYGSGGAYADPKNLSPEAKNVVKDYADPAAERLANQPRASFMPWNILGSGFNEIPKLDPELGPSQKQIDKLPEAERGSAARGSLLRRQIDKLPKSERGPTTQAIQTSAKDMHGEQLEQGPNVGAGILVGGGVGSGIPLAQKAWRFGRFANWKDLEKGLGAAIPVATGELKTQLEGLQTATGNRPGGVGQAIVKDIQKSIPKNPFRGAFYKSLWEGKGKPTVPAGTLSTSFSKGHGGQIPSGISRQKVQGVIRTGKSLRPPVGANIAKKGLFGAATFGTLNYLRRRNFDRETISRLNLTK